MKSFIKNVLSKTRWRLSASGAFNRFDATADMLAVLRRRGFRPALIVDGGAHVGAFARLAHKIFPEAGLDLIEPQPACAAALTELARLERYRFHPVALVGARHAAGDVWLHVASEGPTTGAHVVKGPDRDAVNVPTATLDSLLSDRPDVGPLFLKLDLQGYELEALGGAALILQRTEAVLLEASFFAQAYEPSIAEIVAFFDMRGFALHDIVALSGRQRDGRAKQADLLFVSRASALATDTGWA